MLKVSWEKITSMFYAGLIAEAGVFIGGCIVVPIAVTTLVGGGNSSAGTISKNAMQSSQAVSPKSIETVNLVLAGKGVEDGVVAEISKNGEKGSKLEVKKVTWIGESWKTNWTLYSDNQDGEYTFTDNTQSVRSGDCVGYRHWKEKKVCIVRGRVTEQDSQKWKDEFPKIKFQG